MKEICDDCICVPKSTNTAKELDEEALDEVHKWSKSKNLIFNPDKTRFMIFTTYKSKIRNADFEFHPDNTTTLTRTISTKLGVHFQQQLGRPYYYEIILTRSSFCTT